MTKPIGRLHVITDTAIQQRYTHAQLARLAIEGGADTIQYRNKSLDVRHLIHEAAEVAAVCRELGATFIVNDRVDVALAVDADGVHLGREDMPIDLARRLMGEGKIVGGTVRDVEHLRAAVADGADYVGLGPIFATSSKSLPLEPLGLECVREVSDVSPIPVIAIAGIDASNARSVIEAGAFGIAVIGAVCLAPDPAGAARALARSVARTT